MQQDKYSDSKHASIHDIVYENKNRLRKQQITQLFSTPDLSEFDLTELKHHPYMATNDMFMFFVQELEKWNRKVRSRQVQPFYHAQLKRNMFLLSSLKIICHRKPSQIQRYLEDLTLWYNKNSYNVPQPSVLMKPYNPNEEWEIRKTFKSNQPSEIGNYRRRYLCSPDERENFYPESLLKKQPPEKKQNCFFDTGNKSKYFTKFNPQNLTMDDCANKNHAKGIEAFSQIMANKENKLVKLSNNMTRKKREEQQLTETLKDWKKGQSRFGEKTCQNFFKGHFSNSKQFSEISSRVQPRKVRTAALNHRRSQQLDLVDSIKKGRIRTSLGIRKNFTHEQNAINKDLKTVNLRTQCNEETKDEVTVDNWIDRFVVDEDKIDLRKTLNNTGPNMLLISNPFESAKNKIKKKKR